MRASFGVRGCCPIGLDLGSATIRLTQLRPEGDGWRVLAAAAAATPDGLRVEQPDRQAMAAVIEPLLDSAPFVGRRVVSCLPAGAVHYKNLRLPTMPPADMGRAVAWEAADRMQLELEQSVFEYFDAGEVRQGDEVRQEIIVLAAPRRVVSDHIELLTSLRLEPVAIDAVPGALARFMALHHQDQEDDPARVVLDVGHASSKVLLCRNGQVLFFKRIDVGGRRFDEAVSTALGLSVAEAASLRCQLGERRGDGDDSRPTAPKAGAARAVSQALRGPVGDLVRELALCLRYYSVTFRGKRPGSMVLCGGGAAQPEVAAMLAEQADIEVSPIDWGRLVNPEALSAIDGCGGVWTVCLGLGLRDEAARRRKGAA